MQNVNDAESLCTFLPDSPKTAWADVFVRALALLIYTTFPWMRQVREHSHQIILTAAESACVCSVKRLVSSVPEETVRHPEPTAGEICIAFSD